LTLYKTVSTDEYQYPNRCTGRTKRKLLRAILSFLEGNDVVVTAFSYKYAKMLSRDVKDILCVMNIRDGIILDNSNKILYHDRIMWFTSHDHYYDNNVFRGRHWKVFSDHYFPRIKLWD